MLASLCMLFVMLIASVIAMQITACNGKHNSCFSITRSCFRLELWIHLPDSNALCMMRLES